MQDRSDISLAVTLLFALSKRRPITSWLTGMAAMAMALPFAALPAHAQGLAGPAAGESIADWTTRWLDGPVSLISTVEEQETFNALGTTQERLQFIRLFWERRDPVLRGPRNEYLDEFERRLTYVVENFESRREPAWRTAFGQMVMHFGPPDSTRRGRGFQPDGFSSRPPILWEYDEQHLRLGEPNQMLVFAYRGDRWRLVTPLPGGWDPEARVAFSSIGGVIPAEFQQAMNMAIDRSLVNPVNYQTAISDVRTAVLLPEAQIPFGWSTRQAAAADGKVGIEIDLTTWSSTRRC